MCGRYSLTKKAGEINAQLGMPGLEHEPRYNIAPSQMAPVLQEGRLTLMRWGLLPPWAKDERAAGGLANARAESVASKPAFRRAFLQQRCIVLADGFYEWQKRGSQKIPFRFTMKDEGLFGLAGLWESRPQADGSPLRTFCLITTEPNELTRPVHDRMPVIVPRAAWSRWMQESSREDLQTFLRPYPAEEMKSWPVRDLVNSTRNDLPACVEPAPPKAELDLFG